MKNLKKFLMKFICCKKTDEEENPLLMFYSAEEIFNYEILLAEIKTQKKTIFDRIFRKKKEIEKKRVYIDSAGNMYVGKLKSKKFVPVLADILESLEE